MFCAMRPLLIVALTLPACLAQFKSAVPLVIAPTTVKDAAGNYIDDITPEDLVLYDNNVRQQIRMDWMEYPIDLVIAIQASDNSGAMIDKLGGSGILLTQLLAADRGETAVLSFSDELKLHQTFTADPDPVTHAFRMLRKEGSGANMLDALLAAQSMLDARPAGRRRIVLMIAEKRDRGSKAKLAEVMEAVQRRNTVVYWLTYSPFLQPFTVKPKTAEDLKPEAERIKVSKCALCPGPDDNAVPFDAGPGGGVYALKELARLKQPDVSSLFTRITGGRSLNFLKRGALEQAIQLIGEEVHRQYILTFQPSPDATGSFHSLRVEVKGRPEFHVTTRAGYWAIP